MDKSALAALSIFSFLLIFTSISAAQLGEVAGQPHFNVSIGSSNSIIITVVNQAGYPLPVKVLLPNLLSKTANTVTPVVTAVPMEGNVPSGGDLHINVTVYMPGGTNMPGDTWTGIMQVVTVSNSSSGSGGGAQILEGVAKIVTVTATAHISSLWDYLWIAVVIVVIVVILVVLLLLRSRGMLGGGKKKSSKPAAAPSKAKATARKARTTKRKAVAKKKTATRRRRK